MSDSGVFAFALHAALGAEEDREEVDSHFTIHIPQQ